MTYSFDKAIEFLKTTELTPQILVDLAKQVSIEATDSKTILYSGQVPTGANGATTSAARIITDMLASGEDIRVIDGTPAGLFLASPESRIAAAKASVMGNPFDHYSREEI
jgi:hypothetical protein